MSHHPPKWANRLLEWYCREDKLEDLRGDLLEYFGRNVNNKGKRLAGLIYILDVLKFFRIYTIKKINSRHMSSFHLFNNYWKTSVRSLARNRLFASINIIGLAVSMSVGLVMIVFISELLSFDTFHEKRDRIYRVLSSWKGITDDEPLDLASTGVLVGKKLQDDYTGLEEVMIMRRGAGFDIKVEDKTLPLAGHWVEDSFFDIFSFEVISGNPATMLTEPYSLVITEETLEKFYDNQDVLGKTVEVDGEHSFVITGVIKNPPKNSHISFDFLASFSTWESMEKQKGNDGLLNWNNIWMYHVYMLIEEGTDKDAIQAHLNQISSEENANSDRYSIQLQLEHLSEILPGKDLSNRIGPGMELKTLYIIIGLTLIVILSACFNYTNLSIARSLRRAKEVGIRKVVGASGFQVFFQFIIEAIILSLVALAVSAGLFYLIKPEFLTLDLAGDFISLDLALRTIVYFIVFGVSIGILAGFLPAFILSKVRSLMALKDASKMKLLSGVNLRKVLIVFQFTLSIGFIIAATISYKQYMFAVNFDLGFTTESILNVRTQGNDTQLLANEFSTVPGVEMVSRSGFVLSSGNIWAGTVKFEDPMDSIDAHYVQVDENFLELHNFELLAGENFPMRPDSSAEQYVIANEQFIDRFQMGTPSEAVGKMIDFDEKKLQIIGVVKDFQHRTIGGKIEPFLFRKRPKSFYFVNLKINSADMTGVLANLEEIWDKHDNVHAFRAEFFDDRIQDAYSEYQMMFKVVSFLSVVAVSIASMGLLGMAVYSTESRIKEISIRKVLGATEKNLVYLLSRGFMLLIVIASVVAVPLTFYLFDEMVLGDQANRLAIGVFELFFGVVLIFGIGLIMIGWQTFKAARANPATTLRDE